MEREGAKERKVKVIHNAKAKWLHFRSGGASAFETKTKTKKEKRANGAS